MPTWSFTRQPNTSCSAAARCRVFPAWGRGWSTASARSATRRRCLLARRLVEKGVRFVTVVSGGGPGNMQWDAHGDIEENHQRMAAQSDRPMAALLTDLKRRGLLESTLVLWGGEFGRSPEAQG